jgi:hypothetical protein
MLAGTDELASFEQNLHLSSPSVSQMQEEIVPKTQFSKLRFKSNSWWLPVVATAELRY